MGLIDTREIIGPSSFRMRRRAYFAQPNTTMTLCLQLLLVPTAHAMFRWLPRSGLARKSYCVLTCLLAREAAPARPCWTKCHDGFAPSALTPGIVLLLGTSRLGPT